MAKESKKAKKEAAAKGPVWTREMKERHTRELEGAGPDTASEAESGEDDGVRVALPMRDLAARRHVLTFGSTFALLHRRRTTGSRGC